jgi:hypothetical protein
MTVRQRDDLGFAVEAPWAGTGLAFGMAVGWHRAP